MSHRMPRVRVYRVSQTPTVSGVIILPVIPGRGHGTICEANNVLRLSVEQPAALYRLVNAYAPNFSMRIVPLDPDFATNLDHIVGHAMFVKHVRGHVNAIALRKGTRIHNHTVVRLHHMRTFNPQFVHPDILLHFVHTGDNAVVRSHGYRVDFGTAKLPQLAKRLNSDVEPMPRKVIYFPCPIKHGNEKRVDFNVFIAIYAAYY